MTGPSESILAYIGGKDRNRPHLLVRAFATTAVVEMVVKTSTISFPPVVTGLDAIAEVLVRRFATTYENVYTFCLSAPPNAGSRAFSCDWLVAMSEKEGGAVRVGSGRYDWAFAAAIGLVERLAITIDVMQRLDRSRLRPIMDWVTALPYPWCPADVAAKGAPDMTELSEVMRRLRG